MAHILIREDAPELELLLTAVMNRSGHAVDLLPPEPRDHVHGDLLLVAPTSAGALSWVGELRRRRHDVPVVCVGPDPNDPWADLIRPSSIVPKPFHIAQLVAAVEQALHV